MSLSFGTSPEYEDLEPPRHRPTADPSEEENPRPQPAAESFEQVPLQVLEGEQAEVYCQLLESLIRGGRPNKVFPSGRGLENLVHLLRPSVSRGLSNHVKVNLRNGLPHEPDIGRIVADKAVAHKILKSHDVESVRDRQDEASRRLLRRLEFYREVNKLEVPSRFNLDLKLKRTNEKEETADFIAVFERYDPGEGVFTRYSIDLRHRNSRWAKPKVELQGDDLRYTEEFRNVISRYSSDEAEFAFILLSDIPEITVLSVERGRIGPLWMKGVQCPEPIRELLEAHPGNVILNFPYEKVVVPDVEGKEDSNRDPFARLYRNSLAPENKELADARAAKLGYVVHKERKLSCTKPLLGPLKALLAKLGKPCIVYPAR